MDSQDPAELHHYRDRLDRAVELRAEFGRVWADYLEQRPHRLDTEVNDQGRGVLRLHRAIPMPRELSLILGEFLYQLRAALDNCLYAAAVLDSGTSPPPGAERLQWPICDTLAEWKNQRRRYVHLREDLVRYLESMQPYNAEFKKWNCLQILHDLARVDRHRTLHLVALRTSKVKLWYDRDLITDIEIQPGELDHDSPIVTFTYLGEEPLSREHINGDFEFEVDYAGVEFSVPPGKTEPARPYGSLEQRLRALCLVTGDYMESLIRGAQEPGWLDSPTDP